MPLPLDALEAARKGGCYHGARDRVRTARVFRRIAFHEKVAFDGCIASFATRQPSLQWRIYR